MPRSARPNSARRLSRIRSTHFSPLTVEVVETRTSSGTPSTSASIWPSWGRRRSTMFISAMTLMRLTNAGPMPGGRFRTSCSAPSMRFRMRTRSGIGSMWMSDARSLTAWDSNRFTTWTIGAFSSTGRSAGPRPAGPALCLPRLEDAHVLVDVGGGAVGDIDGPLDLTDATDEELGGLAQRLAEPLGDGDGRRSIERLRRMVWRRPAVWFRRLGWPASRSAAVWAG